MGEAAPEALPSPTGSVLKEMIQGHAAGRKQKGEGGGKGGGRRGEGGGRSEKGKGRREERIMNWRGWQRRELKVTSKAAGL